MEIFDLLPLLWISNVCLFKMASNENYEIPESGAVFTFGKSGFADNQPSHFFIRNDPIVEISCGDEHTAVVCANGRLFLFGQNDYGQLGLGHTRTVTKPSCLKYLKPFHSTHVACGKGHTIVSTKCRRLFSFGSNSDGQLGSGDLSDKIIPQLVNTKNFGEGSILAVSAGCFHSACLTGIQTKRLSLKDQVHVLQSKKKNFVINTWPGRRCETHIKSLCDPTLANIPTNKTFLSVASEDPDNGELYIWGSNSEGQSGTEVDVNLLTPTKIQFDNPITSVSCGYYHTAFISDGNLYTFGEEDNGKLGYRKTDSRNVPRKVELNFLCALVECGGSHTLILSDKGRVFGCGSNFSGQLGIPNNNAESYAPIALDFPEDVEIVRMSAGDSHSAFTTKNGELYTCGDGRYGKTCSEYNSSIFTSPTFITLFANFECIFVSCGGCQTMILAKPNLESLDSDNTIAQSNILTLPPVKVKKTLNDPVNTTVNQEENNDLQDRSSEGLEDHTDSNENNTKENENQTDSVPQIDDVYVDIQGMYDGKIEDVKEDEITENIPDTKMNNAYESATDNNLVIKPDATVKKLFNVFKSKKSVAEKTAYAGYQDGSRNTKSDNSKIGSQNRSKACCII